MSRQTSIPQENPTQVRTASQVGGAIMFAAASLLAIQLVGTILMLCIGQLSLGNYKALTIFSLLPMMFLGLTMGASSIRYCIYLIERAFDVDLNRDGFVGERDDVRLVPVNSAATVERVDPRDWKFFVKTICSTGDWTQKSWRNVVLESGVRVNNDLWRHMTHTLERIGVLVDRKQGASGHLTTTDADEILRKILGPAPSPAQTNKPN